MKGDFSRLTFDRAKHYRRVLQQQGRVELDADANEQVGIDAYRSATALIDVIGPAGYPAGTASDGTALGGFALSIIDGGTDLGISPGRMYVDGLLVENDDQGATLLTQPDLPGTEPASGMTDPGIYSIYLEVVERLITALDDPQIRETALGGPDTAVRSKLTWRVRSAFIGPTPDNSQLPTCGSIGQPWSSGQTTGMLIASSGGATEALPCMLPPDAGYGRLENQLYRVEVHTGGPDGTATFKWSRENGSVAVLIGPPAGTIGAPPAQVAGPTFTVAGLNGDPSLGLQAHDWVEVVDDLSEIDGTGGGLYQIKTTPTDGRTVELDTTTPPTVTLARHPKLRRWDFVGAGMDAGITITPGAPIALEGGLQVTFTSGTYRAGDYWLIPARAATTVQQGFVDWRTDSAGIPQPRPPAGVERHYAALGLVELAAGGGLSGLGTATAPTDCRVPFHPLTNVQDEEGCGPCTIVVSPGTGWELPVLAWFATQSAAKGRLDAEICFPVGDFPVSSVVTISNGGHIRVNGAGWGTRLLATGGAESVLQFTNCTSVAVRDLYAETTTATIGGHLQGTLNFVDCDEVTVDGVWARCGSGITRRGAACIAIASTITDANARSGTGSARVRGCRLHPGEMQIGVQLVHQFRIAVQDNEIAIDPNVRTTSLGIRLTDQRYLAIARSYLISGKDASAVVSAASSQPSTAATPAAGVPVGTAIQSAKEVAGAANTTSPFEEAAHLLVGSPGATEVAKEVAPAGGAAAAGGASVTPVDTGSDVAAAAPSTLIHTAAKLQVGNQELSVAVAPGLASTWQTYLAANAPTTFATTKDAANYVKNAANTILTTPSARVGYSSFAGVMHGLQNHVPLASRGISIGGRAFTAADISGNTMSGILTGVIAGVSHTPADKEITNHQRTPDRMGEIHIVGNVVLCSSNDVASRSERYGIFVGNAASVTIERNLLALFPAGTGGLARADAIRVVGYLGNRAIVRGNEIDGFALGVRLIPLGQAAGDSGIGPAAPVPTVEQNFLAPVRGGSLYLVADNYLGDGTDGAPRGPWQKLIDGPALPPFDVRGPSVMVDNVVGTWPPPN